MVHHKKITLSGIVQGVGFRPFVYRLAQKYDLKGYVANQASEVIIHVECHNGQLLSFLHDLYHLAPPFSKIHRTEEQDMEPVGFSDFQIRASLSSSDIEASIPPDLSICENCRQELHDSGDKRYNYPFTNCTHCGPRFTITSQLPYDRRHTSMKSFIMCSDCQKEYDNPLERRFHAQPNACPACGPHLELYDSTGSSIKKSDVILSTSQLLKQGLIVAIKSLGGFQLAVDATNNEAVERLRQRKNRWEKPFAIMVKDLNTANKLCMMNDSEAELLRSAASPIVLLEKKTPCPVAPSVSPGNRFLGVLLPYTPLHCILLSLQDTLVMTSGNLSEEPIAVTNTEAFERLADIADYFVLHNRDIVNRCDDSVIRIIDNQPMPIRRSRGYVPLPVILQKNNNSLLAVGAEQKNTICLLKNDKAYLSQHIGDLQNVETNDFFIETINHFNEMLHIEPKLLAYDFHPAYFSSLWVRTMADIPNFPVQHHHAHIASCLAENQETGPVIGFAFDGTGLGLDNTIWGGEILIADLKSFERAGHLEYYPMPGGDAAIREPWRMAVSYAYQSLQSSFDPDFLSQIMQVNRESINIMTRMIKKNFNCPLTSSLGRFFDAVAALIGLRSFSSYEGQPAIELEMEMYNNKTIENVFNLPPSLTLPFSWIDKDGVIIVETADVIKKIIETLHDGASADLISTQLFQSFVYVMLDIAIHLRNIKGLNKIALSGGCFQNVYLSTVFPELLRKNGFDVLTHSLVPPNDGGISLGQAVVAAEHFADI